MVEITHDEILAERLAQLFAPQLFADGVGANVLAEVLLNELPTDHPRRAAVAWRYLELRLPFAPGEVLAQIDATPPPADDDGRCHRVPIAAMLACGHYERAAAALAATPTHDAATSVLRGQLALGRGDLVAADDHLAAARATASEVEDRAAALVWSIEAASRRRDADAITAHAETLDALLAAHGAGTSRQMLALQAVVAQIPDRAQFLAPLFARHADDAKAALCAGVAEEQAQLGPIPRHVHAAFRKLRAEPATLEAALMNVVGLQMRADQREEALATVTYAARLAPRLLPPAAAERWHTALAELRDRLGPDVCRELDHYLQLREDTFLRTMRTT